MSSSEPSNERTKKKPSSKSFNGQLIVVFTFLIFFGTALIITPKDSGDVDEYVRHSSQPAKADNPVLKKVIKLPKLKISDVQTSVTDAKMEIEESQEEALAKTEEDLGDVLSEVESTIKKALKHLLLKKGVSSDEEKYVESQVIAELEKGVKERIESEASAIKEDAEEDLDTTVINDMDQSISAEEIESDVIALRDYFTKEAQEEISYAGKIIRDNLRGIVESIEKKVINDKLGIKVTETKLEDSELQSKVTSVAEDLVKKEKREIKRMKKDVSADVKKTKEQFQEVLYDFLLKKGVPLSQVNKISKTVSDKFETMVDENVEYSSQEVQEEVNEVAQFELNSIVDEDKMVMHRAKQLGLRLPNNENKSDVDVISDDIKEVKEGLDQYMKESIDTVMNDLKEDLKKMVRSVESEVFDDYGIKVTESEFETLSKNT